MPAFNRFGDGDSTYMQMIREENMPYSYTSNSQHNITRYTMYVVSHTCGNLKTQVPDLVGPYEREGWIGWCDEQQHDG